MGPGLKRCTQCKEEKPFSDFQKHKRAPDGLRYDCRRCHVLDGRRWYNENKEKIGRARRTEEGKIKLRNACLKNRYGVAPDHYKKMFVDQEGRCAICLIPQSDLKRRLSVDHCHATGVVRGLLCHKCNQGLGLFGDDPEAMHRAIFYLNK